MFDNRISHDNGQAGTATIDAPVNDKAPADRVKQAAAPLANGGNGPADGGAGVAPAPVQPGRLHHHSPSANGSNGQKPPTQAASATGPTASATGRTAPAAGHDANGRFAKGNAGGPGNPFARQVAALRQALINAFTPEDIQQIAAKLMEQAKAGDVQSAKLVFNYIIGKPAPTPQPDHLDVEEWQGFQREASMMGGLQNVMQNPAPELPLTIVRSARPEITKSMSQMVGNSLTMPLAEERAFWDRYDGLPNAQQAAHVAKLARPAGKTKRPSPHGKKR